MRLLSHPLSAACSQMALFYIFLTHRYRQMQSNPATTYSPIKDALVFRFPHHTKVLSRPPFCAFSYIFIFMRLPSFTRYNPSLPLLLSPTNPFQTFPLSFSPATPSFLFNFLLPRLHLHPLPLHQSQLNIRFSLLPNGAAERRITFQCYTAE